MRLDAEVQAVIAALAGAPLHVLLILAIAWQNRRITVLEQKLEDCLASRLSKK